MRLMPITIGLLTPQQEIAALLLAGRDQMLEPQDLPGRYGRGVQSLDRVLEASGCETVVGGGWAVWRHGCIGRVAQNVEIALPSDKVEEFARVASISGIEYVDRELAQAASSGNFDRGRYLARRRAPQEPRCAFERLRVEMGKCHYVANRRFFGCQHNQSVEAQRTACAIGKAMLERREQTCWQGQRGAPCRSAGVVDILKAPSLLFGVGKLVKAVGELNSAVIELKSLRYIHSARRS